MMWLPIMTEWIQGQPGWIVKLADLVSHQLTDWLIDWLSGELAILIRGLLEGLLTYSLPQCFQRQYIPLEDKNWN